MRFYSALLLSILGASSIFPGIGNAADETKSNDLEISIYNNNLALVKDSRNIRMEQGLNQVAFEGVATGIKPESVIIVGSKINVLEQNYDYDLITPQNIVDKSVGQKVKTVIQNPTSGENIFDQATIISANYGSPVLEFSYGIEANFPGRLVFEKLPESLRSKPTLEAKIASVDAGVKELSLAYLTNGISWKTNYVAKVTGQQTLDLTGWVTINNQSGIDYADAKVRLIAGDVNQVMTAGAAFPRVNRLMSAKAVMAEVAMDSAEAGGVAQQLSGYHLYALPNRTDIKDNQTKQISLIEKNAVKFAKEGRLNSPLYLGGDYQASFEKKHPAMFYILKNVEADNLGLPLPAGVMRFYENDRSGSLQFIGESSINHVAKDEKMELNLGSFFNIFAEGKIIKVNQVSENKISKTQNGCWKTKKVRSYDIEVTFHNGGDEAEVVVFSQNINQNTKIVKENISGKAKNINNYEWRVDVPADGQKLLTYTAEVTTEERLCD